MSDWFKAEFHAEQAHQFYEAGQWEKAITELKMALAVNPHQAEWHLGMGLALDALDRYEEAIESYKQVMTLRGEDTDTLLLLGMDQIRADQPRQAIETLARANTLDPQFEPGYCHRILAHAQLQEHDQAQEMFYLARQIVDHCPACYDHVAHSLASQGQFDKAIWCWQQTLKLDPQNPDVHANLARAFWHKGQPQRAYTLFVQQLRQEPGDIETLLDLGNLLMDMDRRAEAGEKFRCVLEMDPAVAQAHLHLGELALDSGHLDAAQSSLEMALRIDPELGGAHLCLAQVAHKRHKPAQVIQELEAELLRQDREAHHTLDLARMLIEAHQAQPVIELLTTLIDQTSQELLDDHRLACALLYRGVAHLILGHVQEGAADCRSALTRDKHLTLAMYNLALVCQQEGRYRRAWYWLKRARRLNPNDAQIRRLQLRLLRHRVFYEAGRLKQRLARRLSRHFK